MVQVSTRPARKRARIGLVVALASFVVLLLALMPGTASAGLVGSSTLTVTGAGPGSGSVRAVQTIYGPNYQSAINCNWNGMFAAGLCTGHSAWVLPWQPWQSTPPCPLLNR